MTGHKWTFIGEPYRSKGHVMSRAICGGCGETHVVRVGNVERGTSVQCARCGRGKRDAAVRGVDKVTIGGVTKELAEWCADYGHTPKLYRQRISAGMSQVEAITRPPAQRMGTSEAAALRAFVVECRVEDAAETLRLTGESLGMRRQNVEHTVRKALQRAQIAAVTLTVNDAMPDASEDDVADLVAFAISERLGYELVAGSLSVLELSERFKKSFTSGS